MYFLFCYFVLYNPLRTMRENSCNKSRNAKYYTIFSTRDTIIVPWVRLVKFTFGLAFDSVSQAREVRVSFHSWYLYLIRNRQTRRSATNCLESVQLSVYTIRVSWAVYKIVATRVTRVTTSDLRTCWCSSSTRSDRTRRRTKLPKMVYRGSRFLSASKSA